MPYAIAAALDAAAGHWLDALAGFNAALELDEGNPNARCALAVHVLAPAGLIGTAREAVERAVMDGPADGNLHVARGQIAAIAGDWDCVEATVEMARLLGVPERPALLLLRADLARRDGKWQQAGSLTASAMGQWPGLALHGIDELARSVFEVAGRCGSDSRLTEAILALAARADADGSLWRVPAAAGYLMAWLGGILGAIEGAYQLGDRLIAARRRSGHLAGLSLHHLWRPEMQGFRQDVRFDRLLTMLGLPLLWRRTGPPPGYSQLIDSANGRGAGGIDAA